MTSASPHDVTQLLRAWGGGDDGALEKLLPLVYGELRRRARRYMARERQGHSLQSTELIHEAYLRLVGAKPVDWRDRSHFFALSARLMRQILVDHARTRGSLKRGGDQARKTFDEGMARVEPDWSLVELDEALQALAEKDERKSKVVELRFFGGLGTDEVAEILGVTPQTVRRDWRLSKAWLLREMSHRGKGGGAGALVES